MKDGVITGYVITSGGSGYSSPPVITVPAIPGAAGKALLSFSKVFENNGSVSAVTAPGDTGKSTDKPADRPSEKPKEKPEEQSEVKPAAL